MSSVFIPQIESIPQRAAPTTATTTAISQNVALEVQKPGHSTKPNQSTKPNHENQEDVRRGNVLDGFYLLDACGVEFPDEASQVSLRNQNLRSLAREDVPYFTKLYSMDCSDNELLLEPFGLFPQLYELQFQCNALEDLAQPLSGFPCLEVRVCVDGYIY